MRSGGDHLLLCERDGVKEGLHRGLAEAPPTLMRPVFVVAPDPLIKVGLQLGEINTLRGEGQSDTACFDNALEFLVRGGYPLAHAMMMLIPEAWAGNPLMDEDRRAFYEYHAALMEPWDGPAAIAFSDGRQIGA